MMRRLFFAGMLILSCSFINSSLWAADPPAPPSDDQLKTKILRAFTEEPSLKDLKIDVEVAHGTATLTGKVPKQPQKIIAADAARSITGVKKVTNKIIIDKKIAVAKEEKDKTVKAGK